LDHYLLAVRAQPHLFYSYDSTLIPRFQQAGQLPRLAETLAALDVRQLGVGETAQVAADLIAAPATRPPGVALPQNVWAAAGPDRPRVFSYVRPAGVAALWEVPETYDMVRATLLPRPGEVVGEAWAGADLVATQFLGAAAARGTLAAFLGELE